MNARWFFRSALCTLFALSTSATNSVAQDYVAGVLSFGHNATALAAATVAPGSTRYLAAIDGASATSAQGDIYKIVIPRKGVLRNLYWRAVSSGLAGSGHSITVLKQTPPAAPVPTALTVTWTGTTLSGSNTTDIDSVNAGDVISVRVILAGGGSGLVRPTVSFEYAVPGTFGSQWATSGSDIYYNTGNVSIGTATAGRTLTVNGTIRADTIVFSSDGSVQTVAATSGGGGTNSLNAADGNPTDAIFVDDNGNVGIGTTTPEERLTKGPGSNSATEMFTPTGVTANVVAGGNLSNGSYSFKIVATDGVGTTVGSAEVSRTITGSPSGYRRIALAWSPVQGSTSYRIYKGSTSGGQDMYHVSPSNSFNYDSDAGTTPGSVPIVTTAYVNKVAASGSSWITGGNFGVGTTVPQEELTLASGSNSVTEMAIPTGVSAAVIAGGNLPVGTHYFRVVASDGVGATGGSVEVSGVVSNSTNDRMQLTWSPVLGAVKYRVYGGTTPGGQNVYYETTNTTFDYDSHSSPGATTGTVPFVTTAYINKFSAGANSWLLGGNVGIGTTSPGAPLEVANALGGPSLRLSGLSPGGEGGRLEWWSAYSGGRVTGNMWSSASGTNGGDFHLQLLDQASNALVDRLVIDNIGRLAIKGAAITVLGGAGTGTRVYYHDNGTPEWAQGTQNGEPTQDFNLFNYGLSRVALSVNRMSNVLDARAGVNAPFFNTSSSRRWKRNIQTITDALSIVRRLRGVFYHEEADDRQTIGLIAEEVGEVIPGIVTYEENGRDARGLDYSRLVAVLIEALKEQQEQIEELKGTVKSLQSQLRR